MITSQLIQLLLSFVILPIHPKQAHKNPVYFYKHLEGTINNTYKIQMDLKFMRVPYDGDSTERFEGSYYYENKGIVLNLTGQHQKEVIELEAFSPQGVEVTEKFTGQFDDQGNFSGTWQQQSKKFSFELKETYANGSVRFRPVTYTFTGKTFPDKKVSPTVSVYQEFFLPFQYSNALALKFLRDSLAQQNEIKTRTYTEKAIQADMATQAKQYVIQSKQETAQEKETGSYDEKAESMFQYNRDQSKSINVLFNTSNLLSIGFGFYEYTGGAHGMYGVTYRVYDLISKKRIGLKHLFKQGTEAALKTLLVDYAKRGYGLSADQKLTEAGFFESTLPLTRNFYLTHKTITFTYMPYEVAPYAMGMVAVTIPYEKVKPLLKETSPVSRFWSSN